jgi:adenylosuccinate lyase/3-carboxy-cis,cis-muconate cycloisomerase
MSIKKAFDIIFRDLRDVEKILIEMAAKYKKTVMAGRTHGQHALPITFGFKSAIWASEVRRSINRMKECRERVFVGQMSGAVGTMAGFGDSALDVCNETIKKIGLNIPDISWQSSRDRIIEIVSIMSIIATTLGKISHEITTLQKTEFSEIAEGFTEGKVGSSTMPHKRNPGLAEAITTLSKIAKSNMELAYESMFTEHERDGALWKIEWYCVSQNIITAGTAVAKAKTLLKNLVVFENKMRENLDLLKGLILSEPLMMALGEKIGKQKAHEVIYQISMKTFEQGVSFKEMLLKDNLVRDNFNSDEISSYLDPGAYTGKCDYFVDKVVSEIEVARKEEEKTNRDNVTGIKY